MVTVKEQFFKVTKECTAVSTKSDKIMTLGVGTFSPITEINYPFVVFSLVDGTIFMVSVDCGIIGDKSILFD